MDHRSFLSGMKTKQLLCLSLFMFVLSQAKAQEQKNGLEVYGYTKTDIGYNFNQIDPDWFDVMRVTKLPAYKDQFAPDGKIYFSLRQTRLGFNSWSSTPLGQLKANFEFDLFPQSYIGTELIWGGRKNFNDGFASSALRVQCSFKYNIFHSFD